MSNPILHILSSIFIGIGATLIFDLWGLLLKHAFKIPSSNFCIVGRWILYMPEGVFRHSNINAAPKKSAECITGWATHYLIGMVFAFIFLAVTGNDWLQTPRIFPALIFGTVTVSAPFFIMQPAFGQGIAASRAGNPAQARFRSLINHLVFGFGLYLFGLMASWMTWKWTFA